MKEEEIDRTRGTSGRDDKYIQAFSWNTRRKKKLGRLGTDGAIILKCILKIVWGCTD